MNGRMSGQGWKGHASRQSESAPVKVYQEMMVESILGSSHLKALHAVIENQLDETALSETNNSILERNRALIQYISALANSNDKHDTFNYEFVESLLNGGADINIADKHGQTMFHEIARSWNIDVAEFLLKNGGLSNKQDKFGRTPLHVAASVDFVEMTEFLLQNNTDIDIRTFGECQAPIHYAAKGGGVKSLKMLLGYHANIDSLDSKQRTPLQLAAQWTRAESVKVLIDEGASSCLLDSSGNSALSILIDRLPQLALKALDQLHSTDIITMNEFYYLTVLEESRLKMETKKTRTPLEMAVTMRKYDVVMHPVMQRLIHNKWKRFGRQATIFDLLFFVTFNLMWTAMSVTTPYDGQKLYEPLSGNAWRVFLILMIGICIIYQVATQARATMRTIKSQNHWIKWQTGQLEEDLKYCHPRWIQEKKTINLEIKRINNLKGFSGTDAWFYYDWIVLVVMLAALTVHFIFYKVYTNDVRYVYIRILSIANVLVWLRLLKNVRPFPGIGTLVIILGETIGDFVNWAFLFCLLLVPFSAAFWIIFGGISANPVPGYEGAQSLLYSVFRMAVGDDFNFEGLAEADPVMSRILTVIYITTMTIVTLNLLIALLSETFGRVYSNAVANTIMQRAIKVIQTEQALSKKSKLSYREYMKANCNPETRKSDINIDKTSKDSGELQSNIGNLKKIFEDRFAKGYGKNMSDFDKIRQEVRDVGKGQKLLLQELTDMLELLIKETKGYIKKKKTPKRRFSFESAQRRKRQKSKRPGLSLGKWRVTLENQTDSEGGQERNRKAKRVRYRDIEKSEKRRNQYVKDSRQSHSESSYDPRGTSVVPYGHHFGNNGTVIEDTGYENDGLRVGTASDMSDWEAVSLDSLTL